MGPQLVGQRRLPSPVLLLLPPLYRLAGTAAPLEAPAGCCRWA